MDKGNNAQRLNRSNSVNYRPKIDESNEYKMNVSDWAKKVVKGPDPNCTNKIDDLNKYKADVANLARIPIKPDDPKKDAKNLIYYRE